MSKREIERSGTAVIDSQSKTVGKAAREKTLSEGERRIM